MSRKHFSVGFSDFSVGYDAIAVDDILDIHKYLMKKNDIIKCLYLFKKCFLHKWRFIK